MRRARKLADVAINIVICVAMLYLWARAALHYVRWPGKRLRLH
jgi:hypothetical protein